MFDLNARHDELQRMLNQGRAELAQIEARRSELIIQLARVEGAITLLNEVRGPQMTEPAPDDVVGDAAESTNLDDASVEA